MSGIVLVTGTSGFLGQHIVKILQEFDDNVKEIRLLDRRPFVNRIGIEEHKDMFDVMGDINNPRLLEFALEDVDCVIHCAANVDLRIAPDARSMLINNVQGTRSIIVGCLKKNVPRLIFASTSAVVCGEDDDIWFEYECNLPKPSKYVLGKYAETKAMAEELMIFANGKLCADGRTVLNTVILRPTPIYGEYDIHFMPRFFRFINKASGLFYGINSVSRLQISYAGNVAWAFLKAKEKLEEDDSISGECYFINDDTYIFYIHQIVKTFIKAKKRNFRSWLMPLRVARIIFSFVDFVLKFINFFWPLHYDLPSMKQVNYICSIFAFNCSKALYAFGYKPIYSHEESMSRSMAYYADLIRF